MRLVRRFAPYLAALAIVALLLWQIDPTQVVQLLAGADPTWILIGFGFYVLTNLLRAFRFGVLLDLRERHEGSADLSRRHGALVPLRILPEMFALSLFNNTLPSRSGELSFPYFMATRHGMPVGDSTAALLIVRIFDYLAVALLYVAFAALNLQRLAAGAVPIVAVVAALLVFSLLVLATMPWVGRQVMRLAQGLMERLRLSGLRFSQLLLRVGWRAVAALEHMRTPRTYGLTFGWSLLTWLGIFAWFACFMRAIGLPQPYPLVVVGGTFAMLAKAIPFITVGGFGAHEAGWAVGFSLVGMDLNAAIASGFAVNILTLLASAIFGGMALLVMWRQGRRSTRGQGSDGVGRQEDDDVAADPSQSKPATLPDPVRPGDPGDLEEVIAS